MPDIVEFGEFEVDLRTRTLKRNGTPVKVQEQPFRVLVILLAHRDDIVTRECFRTELWAADMFVDFERGLNTAVRKLRIALNDSADNPRFIETIPRVGYRFLHPVASAAPAQQPQVLDFRARSVIRTGLLAAGCIACILLITSLLRMDFSTPTSSRDRVDAVELTLRGRQILSSRGDEDSVATARELFLQAVKLNPALADAHGGLAAALALQFSAGHPTEATLPTAWMHLSRSLQLNSESVPGRLARILLNHGSGQWKQSLADGQQALAAAPDSPEALLAAGSACHSAGLLQQAAIFLKRGVALSPKSVPLRVALAKNHRFLGEYSQGVAVIEPVVAQKLGGEVELMELYNLSHQYDRAHRLAESSLERTGEDSVFWYQWSRARLGAGHREDARQKLLAGTRIAEGLARRTDNPRVRIQLALLYANLHDRSRATDQIAKAILVPANKSLTTFFAGVSWAILGDQEQALTFFEEALRSGFAPPHYLDYFSRMDVIGDSSLRRNTRFQQLQARVLGNVPTGSPFH